MNEISSIFSNLNLIKANLCNLKIPSFLYSSTLNSIRIQAQELIVYQNSFKKLLKLIKTFIENLNEFTKQAGSVYIQKGINKRIIEFSLSLAKIKAFSKNKNVICEYINNNLITLKQSNDNRKESDKAIPYDSNNHIPSNQKEIDFQSRNKVTQRHLRTISHCEGNNQKTIFQKKEVDLNEKAKMINQKEIYIEKEINKLTAWQKDLIKKETQLNHNLICFESLKGQAKSFDFSIHNFSDCSGINSNLNQLRKPFKQNISCENCPMDDSMINIKPNSCINNIHKTSKKKESPEMNKSLIEISLNKVFSKIIASFNEMQVNFLSKASYELIKSKIEKSLLNIRNHDFLSIVNLVESNINIIISKSISSSKRSNLKNFLNKRNKLQSIMQHNIKSLSLMDFPDFTTKEQRSNSISHPRHKRELSNILISQISNKKGSELCFSENQASETRLSLNEFNKLQKINIEKYMPAIEEIEDKNLKKIQNLYYEDHTVNFVEDNGGINPIPELEKNNSHSNKSEEEPNKCLLNLSISKPSDDNNLNYIIESPQKSFHSSADILTSSLTNSGSKISLSESENRNKSNNFGQIKIQIENEDRSSAKQKIDKKEINKFEETIFEEEILQNKSIQATKCTKKISDLSYGKNY